MLPDRVSNPGPLTYESDALLIALRGPQWLEHRWLVYQGCFELVLEFLGKKIHSGRHYYIWDNLV